MAAIEDFNKLDIRVGRIIEAGGFPEAKKLSYKLKIDFGSEIGIRQSIARLCRNYTKEQLKGRLVLAVINFPPRKIAGFDSEVLTLGVPDGNGECVLIVPERDVPLGGKLY